MATTDSDEHAIRDYRSGDEMAITTLFAAVFGKPMTLPHWRWKYRVSGNGTAHAKVVLNRDGEVIGHAGAIPLRGCCRGKAMPFFQICDVMIHPRARGYLGQHNLFTPLLRTLLADIAQCYPHAFCYGFPGRRPFLLGERAKVYEQVEMAVETIRRPGRAALPRLTAHPLDWMSCRLDPLWRRLAYQYPLTLIRDQRHLRWRYAENPLHGYRLIGLYLFGRLIGWAVIREDTDRLLIVDLLIARRWLGSALRALDRVAAARGERTIQLWLPRGWREAAGDDRHTTPVVTTHMIWKPSLDTAEVRHSLYYTMGDVDIF